MFEYHIAEAIRRGMLIGAYHYARPENNGAEVEEPEQESEDKEETGEHHCGCSL